MNPLIMQMQIDLQSAKKEYRECELKAMRLITELQGYASPYFASPDELEAEKIEQCGDELLLVKTKLIELQKRINTLKKELGER